MDLDGDDPEVVKQVRGQVKLGVGQVYGLLQAQHPQDVGAVEVHIHQPHLFAPAGQAQGQANGHAALADAALAAHHHQLVANLLQGPGHFHFFLVFLGGVMSRITARARLGVFAAGLGIGSVRTFIHMSRLLVGVFKEKRRMGIYASLRIPLFFNV